MDKERLARRNKRLTEYQHRLTWREQLRRALLNTYAALPSPLTQRPAKGTFLLIRPDHLGDLILTTPAIQALKQAKPSARLVGLVGNWTSETLAAYPEIDLVLTLPFPGFTRKAKDGSTAQPYMMALQWAKKLRQLRAETAIILRPDHWWGALLAYLAGIPNRIGFDLEDVRPFLTKALPYQPDHAVRQGLRLIEEWTGPLESSKMRLTYPISDADREFVTAMLAKHEIPASQPLVVIHPGAGTKIKRWLPEQWAIVADKLIERLGAAVLFTGNDNEHGEIARVKDQMHYRGISLAGETTVGQLAALYAQAAIVLGPDSGPLHVAVAAGAPTLHLFGPADPTQFGPWGDPRRQVVMTSDIGCRPCNILDWPGDALENHPCIRDITPRRVVEQALKAVELR